MLNKSYIRENYLNCLKKILGIRLQTYTQKTHLNHKNHKFICTISISIILLIWLNALIICYFNINNLIISDSNNYKRETFTLHNPCNKITNANYKQIFVNDKKPFINGICEASMNWPVKQVEVLRPFYSPVKPWMPGHRGVDLEALEGTEIFAPADGIVSFSGKVANKKVVSIKHGYITSTFEPALTDMHVGESVKRGQFIGYVSIGSDHCDNSCVQWGLKISRNIYEDPEIKASMRRIVWKSLESKDKQDIS